MTNRQISADRFAGLVVLCFPRSCASWPRQWPHLVEQRRWVNEEEFADILSLCQSMLGPNVVGIAVYVGVEVPGLAGAIPQPADSYSYRW
jgi:hypothetical protein